MAKHSRGSIIEEIRRITSNLNQDSLTQRDFAKHSKIGLSMVRYYFGTWNNALKAADFKPVDNIEHLNKVRASYSDEELLAELIRLGDELGQQPTESYLNAHGKYSTRPYKKRWGNLKLAWRKALEMFPDRIATPAPAGNLKSYKSLSGGQGFQKKQIVGELLNFRGLTYAPVDEQGVVFLFGIIFQELGFVIDRAQTAFPDCIGKRCVDQKKNLWQDIRIEFEFASSNFQEHGHSTNDCDLIICWIHDWKDCPLEVIELSKEIKFLSSKRS